ncbi:hypothetical protein Q5P01_000636 [Channa striata]|uniref:Uncharacterized protein n=1 Tax=Channa striata TaxID=64152 RepID=A0AA88IHE8_CHASR|nr:hypothetical protein Q5P01_000636 [Channa striata]
MTRSATVSTASPAPSPVPPTKTEAPRCGPVWFRRTSCGRDPTMISPGVMIADRLRNPSLAGCRNRYRVTVEGSDATGIPAGSVLEGPAKKVRMEIARPYPRLVRPACKHLSRSTVIPVVVGQRTEIQCEGFGWGLFDEVFWLTSPCREEGACKNDFVGEEAGRLFERDNVNTTLVENALGDPLSKTLVLDPVVESDLKGAFFCKLESTRRNDVVACFEARRDGTEGTANNGHWESEPRAATRGQR